MKDLYAPAAPAVQQPTRGSQPRGTTGARAADGTAEDYSAAQQKAPIASTTNGGVTTYTCPWCFSIIGSTQSLKKGYNRHLKTQKCTKSREINKGVVNAVVGGGGGGGGNSGTLGSDDLITQAVTQAITIVGFVQGQNPDNATTATNTAAAADDYDYDGGDCDNDVLNDDDHDVTMDDDALSDDNNDVEMDDDELDDDDNDVDDELDVDM